MASEQTVVAIGMFAVAFLWYSNELNLKGSYLWGQAFQIFCFLFMIADFTVMGQMFRADTYYDLEDLVLNGTMTLIVWLMWALTFTWVGSLILNIVTNLKNPELENANSIGYNRVGTR